MAETLEEYFTDWEAHVFGFWYGSGEEHTIPALKAFFRAVGDERGANSYDHEKLEAAAGPVVAWLLINILCHADIIEYGTSPRYGWLTPQGARLKAFIDSKTADELEALATDRGDNFTGCGPSCCNCGPNGFEQGRKCGNPFWVSRT